MLPINILHLELLAIFHGLALAWDCNFRVIDCQSNSLEAVSLVKTSPSPRHEFATLIWDINDMLSRPWRVELHHILREGKFCADFLAKHDASQIEDLQVTEHPPQGVGVFLSANARGVPHLRT